MRVDGSCRAAVALGLVLAVSRGSAAQSVTACQQDSVLASPEVSNPSSCAAWYNNAQDSNPQTMGPFYPAPSEIRVVINPSIWNTDCDDTYPHVGTPPASLGDPTTCNPTGGFGAGPLTLAEAQRYIRTFYSLFHSKTGSRLSYRWEGAKAVENYCEGGPAEPPALYIMSNPNLSKTGQGSRWVAPDNSMHCALLQFKLGTPASPLSWAWYDPVNKLPAGASSLARILRHETGHTLGLQHQSDAPVGSPPEDDHTATTKADGVDGELPPPGLMHEPVHMADQRYFRLDYGVPDYVIRDAHGLGFSPATWDAPQLRPHLPGHRLVSAVSMADSDTSARGYAYNAWEAATAKSRLAVTLFENGVWKMETGAPNGWSFASWSRPDVAKSFIRRSPEQDPYWIVAFLEGAVPNNSGSRYPSVTERPVGGGPDDWVYTDLKSLVPTTVTDPKGNRSGFDSVAITYDPLSARYVLAWIEREADPATSDTEAIRVSTRLASDVGGAWTTPQTVATTRTTDGADLACSRWPETTGAGYNCVLVWAHGYSGEFLYRRFKVGTTGALTLPASNQSFGRLSAATGYHRPSVTVNPLGGVPEFRIAYSNWNDLGLVFTALLQPGGDFVQSDVLFALPAASRHRWFGPPGIATYVEGGAAHTSLSFAY